MSLDQVVYISRSTIPLDTPLDVADILEVSSRNNGIHRITGALTYCDDRFVQILEGPPEALDWLVDRLRYDPRHTEFEILGRVAIRERAFPEWSMLFPTLTPTSQSMMARLIADGRRHAPAYRSVLLTMAHEFRRSMGGF